MMMATRMPHCRKFRNCHCVADQVPDNGSLKNSSMNRMPPISINANNVKLPGFRKALSIRIITNNMRRLSAMVYSCVG